MGIASFSIFSKILKFKFFQTLKAFSKHFKFRKILNFQNFKFKKLLDQFDYVLQGDLEIERKMERWKREKEESIET